ncbi:MAG: GNAT family N-acetyltransferase [Alphaproteobacteria bacterium]|nr:MAG: GNAT family N-acetyltransferase [Alphaproteobacteria bacterium]
MAEGGSRQGVQTRAFEPADPVKGAVIRDATDADAADVIALIDLCFSAYPGCVMDLPGLDSDLPRVATHFASLGGRFWVVENGRPAAPRILGCGGVVPGRLPDVAELKRLYVHPTARRCGLARQLVQRIESWARARGAQRIELWSDTRFHEAHAFYLALGYRRSGRTRRLNDPSDTTEFHFEKFLT